MGMSGMYHLSLQCDDERHTFVWTLEDVPDSRERHQYRYMTLVAETRDECIAHAVHMGWRISKNGNRTICPMHNASVVAERETPDKPTGAVTEHGTVPNNHSLISTAFASPHQSTR